MKAEVLKGHLDALLLATLERGPQHGYAIRDSLRVDSYGRFARPSGTVSPGLYGLERAGLIVGSWTPVGERRKRRSYELTAGGRGALAEGRSSWREFATAVSAVLFQKQ